MKSTPNRCFKFTIFVKVKTPSLINIMMVFRSGVAFWFTMYFLKDLTNSSNFTKYGGFAPPPTFGTLVGSLSERFRVNNHES